MTVAYGRGVGSCAAPLWAAPPWPPPPPKPPPGLVGLPPPPPPRPGAVAAVGAGAGAGAGGVGLTHALSASPVAARNSEMTRICREVAEAGWGAQSRGVGGCKATTRKRGGALREPPGSFEWRVGVTSCQCQRIDSWERETRTHDWMPTDTRPEIASETLVWTPRGSATSFTLDVAAYFRAVYEE